MQISENGLKLIEFFEWSGAANFRGSPYQDPTGTWTIGYGHTQGVGPDTPPITEAEGEVLLKQDIAIQYGRFVNDAIAHLPHGFTQNEFDATVSFVYNLGPSVLSDGGFGRLLRAGLYVAAADSMLGYDHSEGVVLPGLRVRRERERQLFLTPDDVPPTHPRPVVPPIDLLLPPERKLVDDLTVALHRHLAHRHEIRALKLALTAKRVAIYRAAVDGVHPDGQRVDKGWDKLHRLERYHFISKFVPPPVK